MGFSLTRFACAMYIASPCYVKINSLRSLERRVVCGVSQTEDRYSRHSVTVTYNNRYFTETVTALKLVTGTRSRGISYINYVSCSTYSQTAVTVT